MTNEAVSVRLGSLVEAVDAAAASAHRSRSDMIRLLIQDGLSMRTNGLACAECGRAVIVNGGLGSKGMRFIHRDLNHDHEVALDAAAAAEHLPRIVAEMNDLERHLAERRAQARAVQD